MPYDAYFVMGTNGHGKPVEVFQPNIDAARVTRDRLVGEGLTNVVIEHSEYLNERRIVE